MVKRRERRWSHEEVCENPSCLCKQTPEQIEEKHRRLDEGLARMNANLEARRRAQQERAVWSAPDARPEG